MSTKTLDLELLDLEAATFEVDEITDPTMDLAMAAASSSSCSCSSCCSCSTSSCCSTSTSTSSCG